MVLLGHQAVLGVLGVSGVVRVVAVGVAAVLRGAHVTADSRRTFIQENEEKKKDQLMTSEYSKHSHICCFAWKACVTLENATVKSRMPHANRV